MRVDVNRGPHFKVVGHHDRAIGGLALWPEEALHLVDRVMASNHLQRLATGLLKAAFKLLMLLLGCICCEQGALAVTHEGRTLSFHEVPPPSS